MKDEQPQRASGVEPRAGLAPRLPGRLRIAGLLDLLDLTAQGERFHSRQSLPLNQRRRTRLGPPVGNPLWQSAVDAVGAAVMQSSRKPDCNLSSFKVAGEGTIRSHVENNAVRRFLLVLGALAIVVASFFVTLWILNIMETPRTPAEIRNATRAEHARQLKAALEKFKAAKKSYPASPDFNDLGSLQQDLVGGGYLAELPSDPQGANGKKYRYASNGTVYGLLFELEAGPDGVPAAGTCISRAKTDTTSFKGYAADCPF
jgi:hypothetical protein